MVAVSKQKLSARGRQDIAHMQLCGRAITASSSGSMILMTDLQTNKQTQRQDPVDTCYLSKVKAQRPLCAE